MDLRTPLTNIRGYLEGLKDHVVDPTQEIIVSLYEESLILSRLVVDLQELSLAEAGQLYLVSKSSVLEEIIISARANYDEIVVSVQDTGEGIEEEHLPTNPPRACLHDHSTSLYNSCIMEKVFLVVETVASW